MFSKQTYIARRATLSKQVSGGIILLLGNGESPINFKDNAYPFRQDSTFLYYLGIQSPRLTAIIDVDGDRTTLFGDELSMDDIIWMGRQETLQEKAEKAGISDVLPLSTLPQVIQKAQQGRRPIHFLPPYRAENHLALSRLLAIPDPDVLQAASVELIRAVVAQRSVKSADEIGEIEKAVDISVAMHLAAMAVARPGMSENELAASVQYTAQKAGGSLAYPTILTVRGEILHNHYHGNILAEGQLVLNDSGAETAMGYAGDLTRTFPAGKQFTAVQKEAYEVVLQALQTATDALKPGVRYLDIHFLSCRTLVEGLKALGLMHGDTEEAVAAGAHTLFFQCGTGHMLGLDVHDMEDLGEQHVGYTATLLKDTTTFGLKSLRLGKALQAGYVLTVEPGLYFIPELIDQWKAANRFPQFIHYQNVEAFRRFGGIRIEDNVVITETGYRILGKPLAKTIPEIEAIRGGAF
ncbi:aminopeptidase P family protein [Parapedobacter sp. ISTM3]|uniref:aminopeptidase P family protein n=1 Tax=Parapedobacter sp. ISTM3 TaxID=2800130 RepID=UPI001908F513|nr:aminopeptidase P family protein [Parapedobacter sp. ISTM3]MBK1440485.1 aminopeptidase P family protein [Parapedobacter sp. ISTM3]